ncbi:hypothetical protein A9267_09110 [Shewanella sp. UCD-FRSSP16_17]|uniref:YqcC family protein n=1 Tax=Shewanella sp. UCD-FRSSP16_17 TaxID=1853256 RepID=UPI0007EEBFEE|nr:YqcC family protein [Shewanella sp. UCD-FRSSP16_17]OBT09155.1 hypothetical protein A9267_09110 [Shewanella sp. UCD-FRSSP16_17]
MPYIQTVQLLESLEQQLKINHLWSIQSPSDAELASVAPFACDTLRFEQWLQFIFIPKMSMLIRTQSPLPSKISLAPMAEHVWGNRAELAELTKLLAVLDNLLTGQ